MNKQEIILIGGGGHCRSCMDVIESEGRFTIAGIVDLQENIGKEIMGHNVIASDENLEELSNCYSSFLITLGQIKSGWKRMDLFERVKAMGGCFPTIISPRAYVSKHAEIGEGTIVMHVVIVNANAKIGANCILNTRCLIEHDAIVGNHCHISTGAIVNGECIVGDHCFIGSHATLAHTTTIGNNSIVGAGSIVLRNLDGDGTYLGYPAIKVK
jgi:sugar O-acyltransferase (sialic acid O-acetyltransferase NeuD family)